MHLAVPRLTGTDFTRAACPTCGNWTTRGYANSRTGHLADWSTRRLDNSRTGQVADWTTRDLADAAK